MKKVSILFIFLLSISLTGCKENTELSDEENDIIAEYIAGKILQSDKYYESNLVEIKEDDSVDKGNQESSGGSEEVPSSNSGNSNQSNNNQANNNENNNAGNQSASNEGNQTTASVSYIELSDVLGNKNYSVKYKGYLLVDSYPEESDDSYFTLLPTPGKKKLVLKFGYTNTTKDRIALNTQDQNIVFQLSGGDENSQKPVLGLLLNDIRFIETKLNAGESYEAVIVFEVDESINLEQVSALVTSNKGTSKIKVK